MRPEDIDAIIGQAEEHQTNWGRPRYSEDEMREAIRIAYVSGLDRAARVADIEAARRGRQLLDLLEQVRPWLRYFTYPNWVRKPGKLSSDELEDLCDAIDVALGPEETNYE